MLHTRLNALLSFIWKLHQMDTLLWQILYLCISLLNLKTRDIKSQSELPSDVSPLSWSQLPGLSQDVLRKRKPHRRLSCGWLRSSHVNHEAGNQEQNSCTLMHHKKKAPNFHPHLLMDLTNCMWSCGFLQQPIIISTTSKVWLLKNNVNVIQLPGNTAEDGMVSWAPSLM